MAVRISIDNDTWWHLRAGQWMVENRLILRHDWFSHTRYGEAWNYPGWLVEIPMYLIYRSFGPGGLNIWTGFMVASAFSFTWRTLTGGSFLKAFTIVLAAAVAGVYWAARPHLVTFLFTATFVWVLENHRWDPSEENRKKLYWLSIGMVLWANSHGGFAVGFLLWGIYWISDLLTWILNRSLIGNIKTLIKNPAGIIVNPDFVLWKAGLLLLLAVCINPAGPIVLVYPLKTISIGALQDYIQEWQSPNFHSLSVQPFLWLIFISFGVVGLSRKRLALTDFLLIVVFAYLGFLAARNIALFALTASPVVSRHAHQSLSRIRRKFKIPFSLTGREASSRLILNWTILGFVILLVIIKASLVYPLQSNLKELRNFFPVNAVSYVINNQIQGRLFNSYNWGGYLIWTLPDSPVFIDGRTDLYDGEIIQDWLKVVRLEPGWGAILNRYEVDFIMIESGSVLAKAIENDENWISAYQDPLAQIFIRRKHPENSP